MEAAATPIKLSVTNLALSPRFTIIWQEWRQAMRRLERLEREASGGTHDVRRELAAGSVDLASQQTLSKRWDSWAPNVWSVTTAQRWLRRSNQIKSGKQERRISLHSLDWPTARAQSISEHLELGALRARGPNANQRHLLTLGSKIARWPAAGAFQDMPGTARIVSRRAAQAHAVSTALDHLPIAPLATHPDSPLFDSASLANTPTSPWIPTIGIPVSRATWVDGSMGERRVWSNLLGSGTVRGQSTSERVDLGVQRILSTTLAQRRLRFLSGELGEESATGAFHNVRAIAETPSQSLAERHQPAGLGALLHAQSNEPHGLPVGFSPPRRESPPVERLLRARTPTAPSTSQAPKPAPNMPVQQAPQIDISKLDSVLWQRFEKRLRIERERRGRF